MMAGIDAHRHTGKLCGNKAENVGLDKVAMHHTGLCAAQVAVDAVHCPGPVLLAPAEDVNYLKTCPGQGFSGFRGFGIKQEERQLYIRMLQSFSDPFKSWCLADVGDDVNNLSQCLKNKYPEDECNSPMIALIGALYVVAGDNSTTVRKLSR